MAAEQATVTTQTAATTTPAAIADARAGELVESDATARSPGDCGLRAAQDQFIQLWGQMGSNWGIPRTMAEAHALLYIAGQPLNTDDVMDRLKISRGNASMTLRNLVDWGLVTREHRRGDRKEYFSAEQDVWKLFRTVMRERKKREIDPLMEQLHQCRQPEPGVKNQGSSADRNAAQLHNQRLDNMLEVLTLLDRISQRLAGPAGVGIEKALRILTRTTG